MTHWGNISRVQAWRLLLEQALQDPLNDKWVGLAGCAAVACMLSLRAGVPGITAGCPSRAGLC